MTGQRLDKPVDIIIAPTCFYLDGRGFKGAAVLVPMTTDFACNNSVTFAWMATY